jgi:hypothetical protein
MEEVFPVLAGVAVGLVAHLAGSIRFRALLIGVFGVAFGACASWTSGELAVSWVYLLVDTAQVMGASVMTLFLARLWLRRQARRVAG